MRKLASIQKILDIKPIEGADVIEVASVLGWKVVVKKGEFSVGDKCVYCEIDSQLPEKEEFEFLRNKKFRIKTLRLKSQISNGICFPMSIIGIDPEIGTDVTEEMGITKWEPQNPITLGGDNKGSFPGYVFKTDEQRIQNFPNLLDEIRGLEFYSTVKCDGSSCTISHMDGEEHVCSRNLSKKDGDKVIFWQMEKKYNVLEKLRKLGNFAVQGEICGPGIQKNRLGLKEHELLLFDVFNIKEARYLDFKEFIEFSQSIGMRTVPIENESFIFDFTIEELLEMVKGRYPNTSNEREGLVFRPTKETVSRVLNERMSFKVINNEYLLKGGN